MKNINFKTVVVSVLINLVVLLVFNFINVRAMDQSVDNITYTYEERENGKVVVDFSDSSYAIINHKENKYIFQPSEMGDWDMQFDNYEHLKMAMTTYFENKDVKVVEK